MSYNKGSDMDVFVDNRIPLSPRACLTLRKMTESYKQQILGSLLTSFK
jgi:hypothetical protein